MLVMWIYDYHRSENSLRTNKLLPCRLWRMNDFIRKKLSKLFLPVIAVLFKSTTMNKWELEAILHFFQVTGGSISSKYMAKSPVQSLFHLTNLKAIIFKILLKKFQNTSCNLKLFGNNLLTRNEDPSTAS